MKIVTLNPGQNKDAIEILEEALRRVKKGELTAVSLSWVTKDGRICGEISSGKNQLLMLTSIENTLWHFKEETFRGEENERI